MKRAPQVNQTEASDAMISCPSSPATISASTHHATDVSLRESTSSSSSSTDWDLSSLAGCRRESNIASYVSYPTGNSASTYDLNLGSAPVGDPDDPVSPTLFIFPLDLGFSADHSFVSEVDLLAFLGLRRSIMTPEPALISFPLASPRAPLAPEHCHVLVCGDGMADENLCYLDAT